jgi:hypothetical protein
MLTAKREAMMYADLDYSHPEVQQDVLNWGKFLANEIPIQGIRFDAIKHFSEDFLRSFITQMDEIYNEGWFFVGEFWKDSLSDMSRHETDTLLSPTYRFNTISRPGTSSGWARNSPSSMHLLCTTSQSSARPRTRIYDPSSTIR